MTEDKARNQRKKVTNIFDLPKPRLAAKDYDFFSTLVQSIRCFKSHDLPGANCDGCIVSPFQKAGHRKIKFVFAAAAGRVIEIDIDIDDIQRNPRGYIEQMLERINTAYEEAKKHFDTDIFIMTGNKLTNAIQEVNKTVIH